MAATFPPENDLRDEVDNYMPQMSSALFCRLVRTELRQLSRVICHY